MSSKGIIDVLFNIESFRNIDLYYQGLYYLQFQVYQEQELKKTYACPYEFQNTKDGNFSLHNIIGPQILEQNNTYCTKVFMIKFSDEIVKIHETGIFRIESCLYSNPDLIVEVELYFTDLNGDLSVDSITKFADNNLKSSTFMKVGSCTLKCVDWKLGANQYCPVVFHDIYACVVNTTIHTVLLDYKFRINESEITDYSKLAQCFFPLCGRLVPDENIDRVFKEYICTLAGCHNRVRSMIKRILKSKPSEIQNKNLKHSLRPPLTFTGDEPISNSIQTRNKKKVTKIMIIEIKEVASIVYQMRFELTNILTDYSTEVVKHLEEKYHEKVKTLCMNHIYREIQIGELNIVADSNPFQSRTARAHRKSLYGAKKENLNVFDMRIFSPEKLAVMFEEINMKTGELNDKWKPKWFCKSNVKAERHLIVLVHGYMGSAYDMKTVKDVLILYKPYLIVLSSESNERNTEGSIEDMGMRLSKEVVAFIGTLHPSIILSKISFIGHSLGGLIVRAALKGLEEYKKLMYAYISLASPHLGCSQFSNKLVEAGLWVILKLKNSLCIQQLSLKDSSQLRDCYLYELARNSRLDYFEKIVLVSSSQDSYVPYESARIEIGIDSPDTIQLEMADSIVSGIQQLHRINVDFPIKNTLIANLHGRAAHISLLDNQSFLNILVYRFAEFFSAV
jgi:pimeloyl-ACP methyl ester carboxylesterase